jgi:hypothetical protein
VNRPPHSLEISLPKMGFFIAALVHIPLSKMALMKGNIGTSLRWDSLSLLNLGCPPNFGLNHF